MSGVGRVVLLAVTCFGLATSYPFQGNEDAPIPAFFEDEFDMTETLIVPEPEDGSRWWYTPSRKANIFKHRYDQKIKQTQNEMKQGEEMRLPGDIIPIEYEIEEFPFVELIGNGNFTTIGSVKIVVEVVRATRNISMNSAELNIDLKSISVFILK